MVRTLEKRRATVEKLMSSNGAELGGRLGFWNLFSRRPRRKGSVSTKTGRARVSALSPEPGRNSQVSMRKLGMWRPLRFTITESICATCQTPL